MKLKRVYSEPVTDSVSWIRAVDHFGWGWNTVSVKLPSGGVFLYSPAWFGADTFRLVEQFGMPSIALAPNHFHHLALRKYSKQYNNLSVVCSDTARPRLERQGHTSLHPLSHLEPLLPKGSGVWIPDGTKTGETWISIPTVRGNLLLVCDAVFHLPGPLRGWKGWALKALSVAPGIRVSRTFELLAVKNAETYVRSVDDIVNAVRPSCVLPSHGDMLEGASMLKEWKQQTVSRLRVSKKLPVQETRL